MNIELGGFFLQIIGLAVVLIGSLWKIFDYINKKFEHERKNQLAVFNIHMEQNKKSIDRIYERMDERKEEEERLFVRLDVHNLTIHHLEEKTDDKFNSVLETFDLKMQNLTKSVNDLISRLNNNKGG